MGLLVVVVVVVPWGTTCGTSGSGRRRTVGERRMGLLVVVVVVLWGTTWGAGGSRTLGTTCGTI